MLIDLKVFEIRVASGEMPPVVVLAEVGGDERRLPIWMTHGGAAAIIGATEEPDQLRPTIHDLAGVFLAELGSSELDSVEIVRCKEGQFFADLVFVDRRIPARPSDAIAIALRVGCPLRCVADVMDEFGVAAESDEDSSGERSEEEVERFLEFLDTVTPEDFSGDDKKP